jgi:Tol biopolymer transport system component
VSNGTILLLAVVLAVVGGTTLAGPAPYDTSWPGATPELFAPGVVNTEGVEINLVFDQDYTELFFARTEDKIFFIYTARLVEGSWTGPERLDLYPENVGGRAVDMTLSPDGQSLYFLGITPEGDTTQRDIWVSERKDGGWLPARRLGSAVNTEHSESYPVAVADGSLYFVSDRPSELGPRNLYRAARRADGGFEPAVPTGPPIDTEQGKGDTFVAADESYLIFASSERGGYGSGDLYIAYRTAGGGWTEPKNMGPVINTEELEFCPMVSPDGRWLSFSRRYGKTWATTTNAEIYWMDASIIDDLRED